jgi:hypothetical protein
MALLGKISALEWIAAAVAVAIMLAPLVPYGM